MQSQRVSASTHRFAGLPSTISRSASTPFGIANSPQALLKSTEESSLSFRRLARSSREKKPGPEHAEGLQELHA